MPDREKVISGLEHCGFTEKRGCDGCPYEDECTDFGCDAGHGSVCTDALALLKEQAAVIDRYHKADAFLDVHGWRWEDA